MWLQAEGALCTLAHRLLPGTAALPSCLAGSAARASQTQLCTSAQHAVRTCASVPDAVPAAPSSEGRSDMPTIPRPMLDQQSSSAQPAPSSVGPASSPVAEVSPGTQKSYSASAARHCWSAASPWLLNSSPSGGAPSTAATDRSSPSFAAATVAAFSGRDRGSVSGASAPQQQQQQQQPEHPHRAIGRSTHAPLPSSLRPSAAASTAPPPSFPVTAAARRLLSVQPEAAVYAGPAPRGPSRVTLRTIRKKYESGEPLSMVTAYDYPSAVHVDAAGIDILLVGDSVAMVVHGHDTTLPISLDDMIAHCKAAARGARRAFLVGDLPFGCYETDPRDAVRSAVRMLKEGGMDAVKLEGGSPARVGAARAIVETGVAVMGHVGLTPQSVSVIGGFRPQAQVADEALRVLDQALALQAAGCFALVLECVPAPIAAAITRSLSIPTIGIGAGGECSGQVLVYHDLLGMMSHPHHAKVTPKFCKQYARVGDMIGAALAEYRREVEARTFPGPRFSPYSIPQHEVDALAASLRKRGMDAAAEAVAEEAARSAAAKAKLKAEASGSGGRSGSSGGSGGAGSTPV